MNRELLWRNNQEKRKESENKPLLWRSRSNNSRQSSNLTHEKLQPKKIEKLHNDRVQMDTLGVRQVQFNRHCTRHSPGREFFEFECDVGKEPILRHTREYRSCPIGFFNNNHFSIFYGYCYFCDYEKHSQNYCPLRYCEKCGKYGHSSKICNIMTNYGVNGGGVGVDGNVNGDIGVGVGVGVGDETPTFFEDTYGIGASNGTCPL